MENIAVAMLIMLIKKDDDELANIILAFYAMCITVFIYSSINYIDGKSWNLIQLIIDLIIIGLCYNSYINKQKEETLGYIVWVMSVYLVPEIAQFSGLEIEWYVRFTQFACIVDVLFVSVRGNHVRKLYSCYTSYSKRGSNSRSNINRHNAGN